MILVRHSRASLVPVELDRGDVLRYRLSDGRIWEAELVSTSAEVIARDPRRGAHAGSAHGPGGDIAAYAISCVLRVNGRDVPVRREVGTQACFAAPAEIDGVAVWLDAVAGAFTACGGFIGEKDWRGGLVCMPHRQARLAVQAAGRSICPEPMALWYETPARQLDIRQCYRGEDCWMGPYDGAYAHCGLDINMPANTVLHAPITFDDHYLFNALAANANNNRWRGIRRWPDGSEWWLQSHHLIRMLVGERAPLSRGTAYATTAGVYVGAHEHTHFLFRVIDQGGDYLLDPWLLFRQMFADAGNPQG